MAYWKRRVWIMLSTAMIIVLVFGSVNAAPVQAASGPKSIIILIGDGMGYNHSLVARFYRWGKASSQTYNRFPVRLAMSTYPAFRESDPCYQWGYNPELAWTDFNYVNQCATDSAAAATAMSTGVKTRPGAVGVDINYNRVRNIMELGEELGKSTGIVTSVTLSHGTPAGFAGHNGSRSDYARIANQFIYESGLDVVMGAGHPYYDDDGVRMDSPISFDYVGGSSTWDDLLAGTAAGDANGDGEPDPWTLIDTRQAFVAMAKGKTPNRVIGVAPAHTTLVAARSGDNYADPYVIPFNPEVPTLTEMTRAALNVLDNNKKGFFLMVEGGAMDWAAAQNKVGRLIEEQIEFDKTVEAVVKWVGSHGGWTRNLVIVTGDHETGYLLGPGSDPEWNKITSKGKGKIPDYEWHSDDHTNSLIAFYARGRGSSLFSKEVVGVDPIRKRYMDNTSVAKVIFKLYGQ